MRVAAVSRAARGPRERGRHVVRGWQSAARQGGA